MKKKLWRCVLVASLGVGLFAGGHHVLSANDGTAVIYTVDSKTTDSSTTDSSSTDSTDSSTTDSTSTSGSSAGTGTGTSKPSGGGSNLPQTGQTQSFVSIVAGFILAALGTALFILRKNREAS